MPCSFYLMFLLSMVSGQIFVDTRIEEEGICEYLVDDCNPDLVCRPKEHGIDKNHYCLKPAELKEPCSSNLHCIKGLVCRKSNISPIGESACLNPIEENEKCSNEYDDSCAQNLVCRKTNHTADGDFRCLSRGESGMPCNLMINFEEESLFDHNCANTLHCLPNSSDDPSTKVCLPKPSEEDMCNFGSGSKACNNELTCRPNGESIDGISFCLRKGNVRERCYVDENCAENLFCHHIQGILRICISSPVDIETCLSKEDCNDTSLCYGGICVGNKEIETRKPYNSTCFSTRQCLDKLICRISQHVTWKMSSKVVPQKRCAPIGLPGDSCQYDYECVDNLKCISFECSAGKENQTCSSDEGTTCQSSGNYCGMTSIPQVSRCKKKIPLGQPCFEDYMCDGSYRCVDFICSECVTNQDCDLFETEGQRCVDGTCITCDELEEGCQLCTVSKNSNFKILS